MKRTKSENCNITLTALTSNTTLAYYISFIEGFCFSAIF